MKRVNYIITLAACLAALLTSCIKEESYTLETLDLQVNVTRAGAESEQQGDKIEDIMIWAFPYTEGGAIQNTAEGWRTYTPSNDTYTSVAVHIPLPMCNGEAKNYRLVAVINKGKFGTIVDQNGSPLTLGSGTTYSELTNARFASDVVDASLEEGKPGTPDIMPVSHWKDVVVTDANIHPTNCLQVEMPVFRTLAKTQLFIARNNVFEITFPLVEIINAETENQGAVLAEPEAGWSVANGVDMPDWFGGALTTETGYSKTLVSAYQNGVYYPGLGEKIPVDNRDYIYDDNSIIASADDGHDVAHYICGKILYETTESCTYNDPTYKAVPTGNGYYYKIVYRISTTGAAGDVGEEITRYVPLPPIVRNHDYQVRAFIKEDGGIEVNYTVADWEDNDEWNLAFDAAQHTSLLPEPDETAEPESYPIIEYTGNEAGAAVFYFKMKGPKGITWKPTLKANASDFEARVYEVINDDSGNPKKDADGKVVLKSEPITGNIEADKNKFYAIKVVTLHYGAMAPNTISDRNPLQLMITHAPQWNDEEDNTLVINPKDASDNYFWYAKGEDGNPTKVTGDEMVVNIYPKQIN